ncbi:MAG: hypothetical protein OEY85_12530 [Rhodospirillales bacterium]|nr:hypothetical protein [Rhodospirillales bacterium]
MLLLRATQAAALSPIDAEVQNLRALPPGYDSWCEKGNLIIKAPASARFRIKNAALCVGKPEGYPVCSSGKGPLSRTDGSAVPVCSQLSAPGA